MINLEAFKNDVAKTALEDWFTQLYDRVNDTLADYTHGELAQWLEMIGTLPRLHTESVALDDEVRISFKESLTTEQQSRLIDQLKILHPWRKGPFYLDDIHIDTEWRSDWKWSRIASKLGSLQDELILDIGCGNGYHLFRMLGAGARMAIGVDTSQKFYAQFEAIKHFTGKLSAHLLPLGVESMPENMQCFDKVFSMGVLYHRKSPIDHIRQLKSFCRPGGEIILETLVVEGDEQTVLVPKDRYAQMRNVWFLPSTQALARWLERCDLEQVRLIDVNTTTTQEQRPTDWMWFHSLENYLDPDDSSRTIEGYPAPTRATFIAKVKA